MRGLHCCASFALVEVSRGYSSYSAWASLWGLLFCGVQALDCSGISSFGLWAQQLWLTLEYRLSTCGAQSLVALWHVGISQTRY